MRNYTHSQLVRMCRKVTVACFTILSKHLLRRTKTTRTTDRSPARGGQYWLPKHKHYRTTPICLAAIFYRVFHYLRNVLSSIISYIFDSDKKTAIGSPDPMESENKAPGCPAFDCPNGHRRLHRGQLAFDIPTKLTHKKKYLKVA